MCTSVLQQILHHSRVCAVSARRGLQGGMHRPARCGEASCRRLGWQDPVIKRQLCSRLAFVSAQNWVSEMRRIGFRERPLRSRDQFVPGDRPRKIRERVDVRRVASMRLSLSARPRLGSNDRALTCSGSSPVTLNFARRRDVYVGSRSRVQEESGMCM